MHNGSIPIDVPQSVGAFFQVARGAVASDISLPGFITPEHPAVAVLQQFSGLKVGKMGAGEECGTGDIAFGYFPEYQQASSILEWQRLLWTTLVNIGELDSGHAMFFMDSTGACYDLSGIHDAFAFLGATFGEALERILLGRRCKAMLRPDQASVTLYGIEFKRGHPEVHWPNKRRRD